MFADPVLKEPNRRAVAQRGVVATPVIEDFDVLKQVSLRVSSRRVLLYLASHWPSAPIFAQAMSQLRSP